MYRKSLFLESNRMHLSMFIYFPVCSVHDDSYNTHMLDQF